MKGPALYCVPGYTGPLPGYVPLVRDHWDRLYVRRSACVLCTINHSTDEQAEQPKDVVEKQPLGKLAQVAHVKEVAQAFSSKSFPCAGGCGKRFPEPDTLCYSCRPKLPKLPP